MPRPKKEPTPNITPVEPVIQNRTRAVPVTRPATVHSTSDNVYLKYKKNGNTVYMSRVMAEKMVKQSPKNYSIV